MKRPFLPEITYMRGLCMLGVIAIHVGSYALSNPLANVQLISVLEILSRFAVPAFFFLSAFGLFYHTSVEDNFSYKAFMTKRIQVVLWPYLFWSLFYTLYSGATAHNWAGLMPGPLAVSLLFGTGMYQLYFLVILLWFYLLMPLWRAWVKVILKQPIVWLLGIFVVQLIIDYISSYTLGRWTTPYVVDQPVLKYLLDMRLNYWVIHYVWIFLLGAVCAERYEKVQAYMWKYRAYLALAFVISVAAMLGGYYYVMGVWHYTLLEAIYTIHQLSPMGLAYTGVGTLFFLFLFAQSPMKASLSTFWEQMGRTSYGMYLIHPLWLIWISAFMAHMNWLYTVPQVVGMYVVAVCASFLSTVLMEKAPKGLRRFLLGH
ncbi:MAG: acyltransferase [Veillonella sp.]|nr:acyltransferase [Veillonella sp.]